MKQDEELKFNKTGICVLILISTIIGTALYIDGLSTVGAGFMGVFKKW